MLDDGAVPEHAAFVRAEPDQAEAPSAGRPPLTDLLAQLESLVDAITEREPDAQGAAFAAEASMRIYRASDRLHAAQLGWLAVAEDAGAWIGTGARSFRAWVARTHEVSFAEAGRWVRSARVWRDVARTAGAAARHGLVSTAKASLLAATANTERRVDALQSPVTPDGADEPLSRAPAVTGEDVLLELAQGCSVEEFGKITRRFAHVVDPEADERGYREALAREHVGLASTTGGYHLSGFLTIEHGQLVKTALRAVTGVPAAGDSRSAGQRRAAALASLSRIVLDKGLTGTVGTVRPHLSVYVTLSELESLGLGVPVPDRLGPEGRAAGRRRREGVAPQRRRREGDGHVDLAALVAAPPAEWEDGRGPVPEHVLRRLATDSEVTRVVFGPDSQVLDVGRTARTFTGHLRRAVVARDRACVVDACGAPPSIGQIHHAVTRWADGGVTSIDNAALVCAFHNQWLEDYQVPMRWTADPQGRGRWQTGDPGTYRPPPPRRPRPESVPSEGGVGIGGPEARDELDDPGDPGDPGGLDGSHGPTVPHGPDDPHGPDGPQGPDGPHGPAGPLGPDG